MMMKIRGYFLGIVLFSALPASAKEYHIAAKGNDNHPGTLNRPFKTINHAAQIAVAGDVITVHAGTYRELVVPKNGGISDSKRITYRAAVGEKVIIKGSEQVKGWIMTHPGIWQLRLPDSFFGAYNPYRDLIYGDWFFPGKRKIHTGEVYLNGGALAESADDEVPLNKNAWSVSVAKDDVLISANFHDKDPNREFVEINVRPACFYPASTGVNYITVRGFVMSQAATQWAAPTAEQIGLIGTNWSKGWIIEDNIVSESKCVGITLGKDRASGHNVWSADKNKDGSLHYNEMIERVIAAGWNKNNIGSHLVRNNTIFNCGAAGICGSFGAAFSQISGNHIYDIYTRRPYWGAEMGGIKIHGAIDVLISGNRVHNTNIGIWLDWMAQGTRVSSNVVYENDYVDFFPEVNHGPYLVDNNLFLSAFAVKDWSEGGAYVHNLLAGLISRAPQSRATPYFKPHTTQISAVTAIKGGGNRFYNNVFVGNQGRSYVKPMGVYMPPDAVDSLSGYGLAIYSQAAQTNVADGNFYCNGAKAFAGEKNLMVAEHFDPKIKLITSGAELYLSLFFGNFSAGYHPTKINTTMLKPEFLTGQYFENPDSSPVTINKDFLGNWRNAAPAAGPFETLVIGSNKLKIW